MSNNACLYNLAAPEAVVGGFVQLRREPVRGALVAEVPDRLPLPWLFAFTADDLRLVDARYQAGPAAWDRRPLWVAVASVASALDHFLRQREALIRLVGDRRIAQAYLELACDGFSALPLPYVALDPLEVVDLQDAQAPSPVLPRALGPGPAAAAQRLRLSGFRRGVTPYAAQALYGSPPEALTHRWRLENAVAMDPGFLPRSQWRPTDYQPPPDH
jgi:hypothetical protein